MFFKLIPKANKNKKLAFKIDFLFSFLSRSCTVPNITSPKNWSREIALEEYNLYKYFHVYSKDKYTKLLDKQGYIYVETKKFPWIY